MTADLKKTNEEFEPFSSVDLLKIKALPKFKVDEVAGLVGAGIRLGEGEVVITRTHEVPEESLTGVGHTQWLEFTKDGLVYDSGVEHYVKPADLSTIGKECPVIVSGTFFQKIKK